jgi:hypothetical protein
VGDKKIEQSYEEDVVSELEGDGKEGVVLVAVDNLLDEFAPGEFGLFQSLEESQQVDGGELDQGEESDSGEEEEEKVAQSTRRGRSRCRRRPGGFR